MTVERNGFQIRDPQLQEGRIHVLEVGAIREAQFLKKITSPDSAILDRQLQQPHYCRKRAPSRLERSSCEYDRMQINVSQ